MTVRKVPTGRHRQARGVTGNFIRGVSPYAGGEYPSRIPTDVSAANGLMLTGRPDHDIRDITPYFTGNYGTDEISCHAPSFTMPVGKGEAGVCRPPPPRCRSEVNSSHLPACGSRTGRPQPKLPRVEELRGVLDHEDLGPYKTLPGSATQAGGEYTPPAAYDCRCSSFAGASSHAVACESRNPASETSHDRSRSWWRSSGPSPESLGSVSRPRRGPSYDGVRSTPSPWP